MTPETLRKPVDKKILPHDEPILMQFRTVPRPTLDKWEGQDRKTLTFMFQVADNKFPALQRAAVFLTVNARISVGKEGNRPTAAHKLLEAMAGKKLGPEWNYVEGWDLTEAEWSQLHRHYPVLMKEPEFHADGTFRRQKIEAIHHPKRIGFPVDTRLVDLTQPIAPAPISLPVPTIEFVLGQLRDYVAQKNGYGAMAKQLLAHRGIARIGDLPGGDQRLLLTLMQIHERCAVNPAVKTFVEQYVADKGQPLWRLQADQATPLLQTLNRTAKQAATTSGVGI